MSKSKRQIKTVAVKALKKSWYQIIAPQLFNNIMLGQSLVTEPSLLLNKTVAANAMSITGDMKKQQITITFKVIDVKDGHGFTSIEAFEVNPTFIKRLVRRSRNKLDMSFPATTKDNVRVRIKPVLLTKSKTSSGICAALRKKTHDFLIKQIKALTFEEVIHDLLSAKLQTSIRNEIKRIYPVKNAEIRMLQREQTRETRKEDKRVLEKKTEVEQEEKALENQTETKPENETEENPEKETEEKPDAETPPAEKPRKKTKLKKEESA